MNTFSKLSIGIITSLSLTTFFVGTSFAQSYNQGQAKWPDQKDAKCYQIFYKETPATDWQFSVRCKDTKNLQLPQYTIKYLKPGVSYTYQVKVISNVANRNQYRWITNPAPLPVSPQPQW